MEPRDVAAGLAEGTESSDRLFSALWSPIGAATIKAARLRPGAHVLDACCGSGASAIPAADQVSPHGVIDAVDLAEASLERGRAKAAIRGLSNVRFVRGDVLDWPAPPGGYDAVVCSLGVSSFPDVAAGTERLLRLVRPGGRLTVAIWSQGVFEPLAELIHRAVVPERPRLADVPRPATPLQPLGTTRSFRDWLAARSLSCIDVQYVPLAVPGDPGLLWSLVSGTRFRGLLDGLPVTAVERVRRRFTAGLLAEGHDTIDFSALVGTGTLRRVAPPRRPRSARSLLTAGQPIGPARQIG
ncbi:class I SAM-dependent methyltransferase [Streptomyces ficellus]|uniref:Class I SAM-dependent methyltransferase n=1 Tax=Streptomyces ficellus TaxID=1977088 RepID=A0ABT7Z7D1_9ACTN|nr:class I SAM-dependent methyltransferase [Streptomyces ficellus]MDN3295409.1 class I SAM-dependent methyltransferase [Streptomyces ficellus]